MKYLIVMLALILTGCGSDDAGRDATLADLVGSWDGSEKYGQEIDEIYFIINENGNFTVFDYYGDSYDQGDNCYSKEADVTIFDNGSGNFSIQADGSSESFNLHFSISGSTLTQTSTFQGETYTATAKKTSLTESDFTPLCNAY